MPLTDRDYDVLSLYIDDALTPPERREVQSRLAADAEYRAELDALRQTVALMKSLPDMIAPRDLRLTPKMAAEILTELNAAQPLKRPRAPVIRTLTNFAAAAASLVLVLAGTLSLLRPGMVQSPMVASVSETVAVADVMRVEETAVETATGKVGDDTTLGMMAPSGTLLPYATDDLFGAGGAGGDDPEADETMSQMQAGQPTAEPGAMLEFSAPAPMTQSDPPTDTQLEEESPESANDTFMVVPSTPTRMSAVQPPATAGRVETTATMDVDSAAEQRAMAQPAGTPALFATDAAELAADSAAADAAPELTPLPQEDLQSDTALADLDDQAARDAAASEPVSAQDVPSPLAGFALVIAGIALGVFTLIMRTRR